MPDSNQSYSNVAVRIPIARLRAMTRGLLWVFVAAILGLCSLLVYPNLRSFPSGAGNVLVSWSIAVVALPLPIGAVACGVGAIRWLLLGLWLGRIGIFADDTNLTLRLGPFGTRTYDARELDVRYPFELDDDEAEGRFEAFLPEEQQMSTMLPRMTTGRADVPINLRILRFAGGTEPEVAQTLRPAIERWRSRGHTP